MKALSTGKLRGLQQISDAKGMLTVCALDHRGSLVKALGGGDAAKVSYDEVVNFKLDLCRAVATAASAVLLDPLYGAAQAIAAGALPGSSGLLVSIEKTGYVGGDTSRVTELLPDWGVAKIKRMGASAVKLLIYFRHDLGDITERQMKLVATLAEECAREDIALLVESVVYPAVGESKEDFSRMRPELVIGAARMLTELSFDILKSEFPADIFYEKDEAKLADYCHQLTEASRLPWTLLSAGVNYDLFYKQAEIAFRAGASGFLAGRALWQEATDIKTREERQKFFAVTARERLQKLADIADEYGTPWYREMGAPEGEFAPVAEGWHTEY
jgi:tagatose 1,6-diphosphate aldolase